MKVDWELKMICCDKSFEWFRWWLHLYWCTTSATATVHLYGNQKLTRWASQLLRDSHQTSNNVRTLTVRRQTPVKLWKQLILSYLSSNSCSCICVSADCTAELICCQTPRNTWFFGNHMGCWFTRWERYQVNSRLSKQDSETQITRLIDAVNRKADGVEFIDGCRHSKARLRRRHLHNPKTLCASQQCDL